MNGGLLVSLSGVRNSTLRDAADFAALLDARGVPLSLLLAPRRGAEYRLEGDEKARAWVESRRETGDALVLNGYDEAATKKRRAEFATIGAKEAELRLRAAKHTMAAIGLGSRVFIPPRWVASPGSWAAVRRAGFRQCADLYGIHDLRTGTVLRSRVLGIGDGFLADRLWCRGMVLAARRTAASGRTLRLSISAGRSGDPAPRAAMLDAVDAALEAGLAPARYGDALGAKLGR